MSGNIIILSSPLDILRRLAPSRGGLAVSLPPRLVGRAEPLFLLVDHVGAAIHPVAGLFARPASLLPRPLAAFLGLGANHIPHFIARAWRIQHSHHRSHPKPCQEPQEAVAFTLRHNCLLNSMCL